MIVRPAAPADAPAMTRLLNEIIAMGGSTAHQQPFDAERMQHHCVNPPNSVACQVVEDNNEVVGFQWLGWAIGEDKMPEGWAIIASFVSPSAAGKGVGQHLFRATRLAAKNAGVAVIDATIRADNEAGLRYYSGLGFVDYDRLTDVPLRDGTLVDRIRKRFDI